MPFAVTGVTANVTTIDCYRLPLLVLPLTLPPSIVTVYRYWLPCPLPFTIFSVTNATNTDTVAGTVCSRRLLFLPIATATPLPMVPLLFSVTVVDVTDAVTDVTITVSFSRVLLTLPSLLLLYRYPTVAVAAAAVIRSEPGSRSGAT